MKEILIVVGVIIAIIGILFLIYKYKKEYLGVVAYYAVIQAEQMYKSKQGQQKLEYAVNYVKQKLPWWIRWLISINAIKKAIEYALSTLQGVFKGAKEKQLAIIDDLRTFGPTEVRLNKLQDEINSNGYVEGYIEGKTNLKGDSELRAGVRAGVKL